MFVGDGLTKRVVIGTVVDALVDAEVVRREEGHHEYMKIMSGTSI